MKTYTEEDLRQAFYKAREQKESRNSELVFVRPTFDDYLRELSNDCCNVTSAKLSSGTSKVQEAIDKFEQELKEEDKDDTCYHLIIHGEYNRETCDEIERVYTVAGWKEVVCRTSSENGERGGLTGLRLYR